MKYTELDKEASRLIKQLGKERKVVKNQIINSINKLDLKDLKEILEYLTTKYRNNLSNQ